MVLCILGLTFSISSSDLLDFLLSLLTQWFFGGSRLLETFFCVLSSLLEILLCLFSLTLSVSTNNFTYLLCCLVIDILSTFFQIFPTFRGTLFDVLISSFFWLHSSCLLSFIFTLLYFLTNISWYILSSFLNVSSCFFQILLCLSGLLLSLGSCHFMNFFSCCIIYVSRNLLYLLPTLRYCRCYILQNPRLSIDILSQLSHLLLALLPFFLGPLF